MDYLLLGLTAVSTVGAVVSAWVAWRQRRDAQAAAVEARRSAEQAQEDRLKAVEAAQRVATAQERLAAIEEDRQQVATHGQAKMIRVEASRSGDDSARVRVSNTSEQPIYEVQVHSVTILAEGGNETPVSWQPHPDMWPVVSVLDHIDGHGHRDLYLTFDEPFPTTAPWSIVVLFRDARQRRWQTTLSNNPSPFEG